MSQFVVMSQLLIKFKGNP